jgi:SPP1 gp7 family putative phage head morphogenesis protein
MKSIWEPKRKDEIQYQKALKKITKALEKKLGGLTDLRIILRTIKKFTDSKEFHEYAYKASLKMVTSLFKDAGKTWRQAARENSKSKLIYEALKKEMTGPIGLAVKEQVERNAKLIKDMPLKISKEITNHVAEETLKGRRSSDIMEDLQKLYPHMCESKAKLIARTECSKTSTALTKARCDDIGINWYEWNTAHDSRTRSSHKHMSGVLVNWNDTPAPEELIGVKSTLGHYNAGNCPNCRCFCSPIVRVDFIDFPHKVYYQGKIQTMTKAQFKSIM